MTSKVYFVSIDGRNYSAAFQTESQYSAAWEKVLALPGANLHLYGKDQPRRARKMGHVTFVAATMQEAQESLREACDILGIAR